MEGSFGQFFGKIQRVTIFEPYEEWSSNFQDGIFFTKASYDVSFNRIWGVNHGTIWWFDIDWPKTRSNGKDTVKPV